ncbi:MAG TPA: SDR family NAD(P)-dependent oxidoreductase [Acidimicrobiales bacterium]|nr:SDR family NAD(P)-dependent oxidoreductase [Acidimicrobiales bacterium]
MRTQRRVVVITGAGGVLGAAVSKRLAAEPLTDPVLSDVSAPSLDATVAGLPGGDGAVETALADVGDLAQVESVLSLAVERFGRLDVLISNAGVLSPNGRIHNLATEEWERAFRINVLGAVNGIKAAVAVMRPQGSGSIVLTASVAGMTAWSHAGPCCATKAAVIQVAKVAAVKHTGLHPGQLRVSGDVPLGHPRWSPSGRHRRHGRASSPRAGIGRRPGGGVLLFGRRRVGLDDRVGDRGRRRLLGSMSGATGRLGWRFPP